MIDEKKTKEQIINELRALRLELSLSETYNDLVINAVSDVVALYEVIGDDNFKILRMNESFLKNIGLSKEQVVGKYLQDVTPANIAANLIKNYKKALHEKKPITYEELDDYNVLETKLIPLINEEGECSHLVVVARDITEKKLAEEKIIFQATLLEQVRNAIIVADLQGTIIYWNKFAETLYQWKAEEIIGRKINEVIVPDDKLILDGTIMENVLTEGYWEGEFVDIVKDGTRLNVHLSVSLLKNTEGDPIGTIGIASDITERKKLESQMARLDRLNLVGEMAAGIGHEVRNPLTTVRGFLQLLSMKEGQALNNEYFLLMIEEIDRANSIITEYLSLAKNKVVRLQMKNLNIIVKKLVPLLRANAVVTDKHIKTRLRKIPDLLLDEREIGQLVANLIRNGIEAIPPGSSLTVRTFTEGEDVILAVQDEGPGIDPDVLDKMGTPFFTTKDQGTGLGLAVCYSIAARHNATINVETGLAGTTFSVRFKQ